jgi:hypothetical protein
MKTSSTGKFFQKVQDCLLWISSPIKASSVTDSGSILSVELSMVRKLIGSILIVSLGSIAHAELRPTILEFRQEMMDHRDRVVQASLAIYEGQGHLFPALFSLPPESAKRLINSYMVLHDLPKIMTRYELEKLGYTGNSSLLKLLHGIWGEHVDPKPAFIEELNVLEEKIKQAKMALEFANIDPALHDAILVELKILERAADVTDTKIFRGKELKFIRKAFSAEKFLQKHGEMLAASLSRWFESKYHPMHMPSCRKAHL